MKKYILLLISIFILVSCGTQQNTDIVPVENQPTWDNQDVSDETWDLAWDLEWVDTEINTSSDELPESDPSKYQARDRSENELPEADPTKGQPEPNLDPSSFPEADPTKNQS